MLDRDLFAIPPGEIASAKVLATLFEGKLVYESGRDKTAR
jgi:predicted amidohydrolase YtcJ